MDNRFEDFDEFVEWLLKDGLSIRSSKRLWKHKIFANLCNGEPKTMLNDNDFLIHKSLKNVVGKKVLIKNKLVEISSFELFQTFVMIKFTNKVRLKVLYDDLTKFNALCKESENE